MTASQLLDNTTSADITEWMSLYRLEHEERNPPPDVEDDLRKVFGRKSKSNG